MADIRNQHLDDLADAERYRAIVQHSYDAIALTDADNTIQFVTPAVRRLFGWSEDELVGRNGFSFVHPDDRQVAIDSARNLMGIPGGTALITFRLQSRNGDWRWVECTSVNLVEHPHVHAVLNSFRDIHDRQEAADRLRNDEERLRALLQNADGVVFLSDSTGVITWAGPSASKLLGLDAATLVGNRMISHVHPDDRREVIRQYTKLASAPGLTVRAEARMRHSDGTWRWYESVFTNCLLDPAVQGVVANVRDVTDRVLVEQALRGAEQRLEHQATHDPLTDLPNRTLLLDRLDMALARARRNGRLVSVLLCDIDNFKLLNDSHSHGFGDEVLTQVAARLVAAARPGDTVARFGGDEFVLLAEDLDSPETARSLADGISAALLPAVGVGGSEVFVTASVGLAVSDGAGTTAEELLRDADAAMYEAKNRGRDRVELFDTGMRDEAVERHQLETALRRAVSRRQLRVHYQPIIDLHTGGIAGVEALVRWRHPQRGLLYPGTFIHIAEETGLIVPLGAWILDTACAESRAWREALPAHPAPFVCVNLSARQLADGSLLDDMANVLRANRVDPSLLHLEITESVLMKDAVASQALLDQLRLLGVRVAIDDFGTGYSSFSYLSRFAVDHLKIDQSFVRQLTGPDAAQGRAIVGAIVTLGHALGLRVVGEGVETAEELAELRALGCDLAQGFWFSGAVPGRRLATLLREAPHW